MQGARSAGIVDHMSDRLTLASDLKQGLQGEDSDLRLDIFEDADDVERKEAVEAALSAEVDNACADDVRAN